MDFHSKKNSLEEAGHKIYYYKDRNGRKRVVVELHGCRDSVPYNLFAQVGEPERVMQAHGEEVHECDCFVTVDSVDAAFRISGHAPGFQPAVEEEEEETSKRHLPESSESSASPPKRAC